MLLVSSRLADATGVHWAMQVCYAVQLLGNRCTGVWLREAGKGRGDTPDVMEQPSPPLPVQGQRIWCIHWFQGTQCSCASRVALCWNVTMLHCGPQQGLQLFEGLAHCVSYLSSSWPTMSLMSFDRTCATVLTVQLATSRHACQHCFQNFSKVLLTNRQCCFTGCACACGLHHQHSESHMRCSQLVRDATCVCSVGA